jgi:hypothetical protein
MGDKHFFNRITDTHDASFEKDFIVIHEPADGLRWVTVFKHDKINNIKVKLYDRKFTKYSLAIEHIREIDRTLDPVTV